MTGKLTISEVAERHLDLWADQLQRGELQIWQLPLALQQYVSLGWAEGMAHAYRQARDYEHQLDIAYMQTVTPKDRQQEYRRRLDEHFQLEEAAFFAAADEELRNDRNPGTRTQTRTHAGIEHQKRAA
jgi:hypothetical protein